jgi:hypothetical protein
MEINTNAGIPLGHQQIAPTASTGLTVPTGARFALIGASVQAVRFTDDGTVPTLVKGVRISVEQGPFWYSGDLSALLFFNDVAGGLVDVLYYA